MKPRHGWKKIADHNPPPEPGPSQPRARRSSLGTRLMGLLLLSLGLYLLSLERVTIAKTGHGGRKSAAVPFIICSSVAFIVDPGGRRMGILLTLLLIGFAASVGWFFLWG